MTSTAPALQERPGLRLLIDWANGQDGWVRAIVAEVIATRRELPANSIDAAYSMFLAEKSLSPDAPVLVAKIGEGALPQEGTEALRIARLSNLAGVNNLAAGQEIVFNGKFTLLFGENATGKTGYVRVLKRVSSVRDAGPILGNVYAASSTSPSAKIEYRLGEKDHTVEWKDEIGLPPLTRISVFDAGAVTVHVDEDLTYAFTPGELALFRHTHQAIDAIKTKLDQAKKNALPGPNPFLARFHRDTVVYPKIEMLGASTDLRELEKLAEITPEDEGELQPLRDKVGALGSPAAGARLELALAELDLFKQAQSISEAASRFDWSAYSAQVEGVRLARERYELVSKKALAGENVPGLFSDAWRNFVRAAEPYLQETAPRRLLRSEADPEVAAIGPLEGDPCPYCQQPLVDEALALVRKYRAYNNSEPKRALDDAAEALRRLAAPLVRLQPGPVRDACGKRAAASDGGPAAVLLTKTASFLGEIVSAQTAVAAGRPFDGAALSASASTLNGELREVIRKIDDLVETLRGEAQGRRKALDQASAQLRTLENRMLLRELQRELRRGVEGEKWAAAAGTLLDKRLPPLLRSLTEQSKEASSKLLDQDFGRLFEDECKALCAPKVRLDFTGRRGEAARKKVVAPNRRPSEILSEGEQKVIALADFLAETTLHHKSAPIVFDDPVNSLDYKRLQYVVSRLVDLSGSHQVIVFTHNIWFAAEILSHFDNAKAAADCTYYGVMEGDGAIGLVRRGTHPRWDTVAKLAKRVEELIRSAAQSTGETQSALIDSAYGVIRSWCEVVVETEILAGVTQRYQPNVMMTRLAEIKPDRLGAARDVLYPLFEKACRSMPDHSQPLETLSVRPTLNELKDDWQKA